MSLLDYTPERLPVLVNGEVLFQVEGISLETLAVLVKTHLPDLEAVFDIVVDSESAGGSFSDHLFRVAQGIALQGPGLAANLIAIASGEEVSLALIAKAKRLPFTVQVDAITKIGKLTFEEAGGVKKAMESLMNLLASLRTKPLSGSQETPASSATTTGSAGT